jgi:hypothetical protein
MPAPAADLSPEAATRARPASPSSFVSPPQFTTLFHGYSEYYWERCITVDEAVEFYRELIRDHNRLPRWAHHRRSDGKHSRLAVLGPARGKHADPADI